MDAGLDAATEALSLLRGAVGAGGDGAREEASRAASLVGTILTQQLRFADAVELAGDVLADLGDGDDAATVRLLLVRIRGAGMIGDEAWEGTAPDRARALDLARALGDPELELEARICTVWDEPDLPGAWADIERLASELRRWPDVAEARRARTALCLPDDLAGVLDGSARLLSFADAHQLDELRAWARYYVAEAGFASGDWSAALASGVAALDLAEVGSYQRGGSDVVRDRPAGRRPLRAPAAGAGSGLVRAARFVPRQPVRADLSLGGGHLARGARPPEHVPRRARVARPLDRRR